MLAGSDVRTGITYRDFLKENEESAQPCTWDKVLYTGMIDEYFDYCLGALEYRSLRFETQELPDVDNFQGNAVVNYTEREVPYTRIIEHKHFEFGTQPGTVITREYPAEWRRGDEPYYPVNDEKNTKLYAGYLELAGKEKMCCSAAGWGSTVIMIWIRSYGRRWIWSAVSLRQNKSRLRTGCFSDCKDKSISTAEKKIALFSGRAIILFK